MRIQNKTTAVLGSNHNATIVVVPETIELLRVRYWQRLQHHRINECENRRGGPDAQGKREHNSSREARRFPQYAQTKAQVLNEILNPIYAAGVAAFFFGFLDPTQVEARAAMRSFLREPLREVFLSFFVGGGRGARRSIPGPPAPGETKTAAAVESCTANAPVASSTSSTPMKITAYLIEKIGSTVSGYFHPSLWLSESHGLLVPQSRHRIDSCRPSSRDERGNKPE